MNHVALRAATQALRRHAVPVRGRLQEKGFIVENKTTPGFSVEKIQNKIAFKVVQNGLITMKDCRVPADNQLQGATSFRDAARVLRTLRYLVSWQATGPPVAGVPSTQTARVVSLR